MSAVPILEVQNVSKRFGKFVALNNVSTRFEAGKAALAELDPEHKAEIETRGRAYQAELGVLHEQVKRAVATIPDSRSGLNATSVTLSA